MVSDASTFIEPFFLSGPSGRLFSIYYRPVAQQSPSHVCLLFPAFADEMNKSRRQVALQARQLAQRGVGMLVVDLYGTGDSEGEFGDATWETWIADMNAAVSWLSARGVQKFSAIAVRLGALLAVDVINSSPQSFTSLVLWQPVVNGKLFLGQFLRLRAAAEMMSGEGGLNTRELQTQLDAGQTIEVAGYDLRSEMAREIGARDLRKTPLRQCPQAFWYEVGTNPDQGLTPVAGQAIAAWQDQNVQIESACLVGELFWTSPEIAIVTDLLDLTSKNV